MNLEMIMKLILMIRFSPLDESFLKKYLLEFPPHLFRTLNVNCFKIWEGGLSIYVGDIYACNTLRMLVVKGDYRKTDSLKESSIEHLTSSTFKSPESLRWPFCNLFLSLVFCCTLIVCCELLNIFSFSLDPLNQSNKIWHIHVASLGERE